MGVHLRIRKANDTKPMLLQECCSASIVFLCPFLPMRVSINFNNDCRAHTKKIDNVGTNGNLATKLMMMESLGPQTFPKNFFHRSLMGAQLFGATECHDRCGYNVG